MLRSEDRISGRALNEQKSAWQKLMTENDRRFLFIVRTKIDHFMAEIGCSFTINLFLNRPFSCRLAIYELFLVEYWAQFSDSIVIPTYDFSRSVCTHFLIHRNDRNDHKIPRDNDSMTQSSHIEADYRLILHCMHGARQGVERVIVRCADSMTQTFWFCWSVSWTTFRA